MKTYISTGVDFVGKVWKHDTEGYHHHHELYLLSISKIAHHRFIGIDAFKQINKKITIYYDNANISLQI